MKSQPMIDSIHSPPPQRLQSHGGSWRGGLRYAEAGLGPRAGEDRAGPRAPLHLGPGLPRVSVRGALRTRVPEPLHLKADGACAAGGLGPRPGRLGPAAWHTLP